MEDHSSPDPDFTEQSEDPGVDEEGSVGSGKEEPSNREDSLTEQPSPGHVVSRDQNDSETEQENDHVSADNPPPGSPLSDNPFEVNESDEEGEGPSFKRPRPQDSNDEVVEKKKARVEEEELDQEEEEEASDKEIDDYEQNELEGELANLEPPEEQTESNVRQQQSSDSEVEGNDKPVLSDFDLMMQRRKEAMAKAKKRKKKDQYDITSNDDHIIAMIRQMKEAADEDRALNLQQKAAIKKLQMLPIVVDHLKKADLVTSFIEAGICSALADWLKPLPDHSLPHVKIRESILDILKAFPTLDSHLLKISNLGKAVMLLYRHPKEIRKNRDKAGKIINAWARPVFGLTSDFKALSREEREERDWAHLSQAAKRRLSSDSREGTSGQDEMEPQKPGEKGWIGRARVPMPSHKDYVVRPKWNLQQEFQKGHSKKVLNRYEKQVQKKRDKAMRGRNTHAVPLSVEGRKMPL